MAAEWRISLEIRERVVLVGVDTGADAGFEHNMEELGELAKACFMQVVGVVTQRLEQVNKALYVGSGKVQEIKSLAEKCEAQMVIFDDALSPSQLRNLQDVLELPVMDRTALILDIFALRAQTKEAKLQVETARLQYLLPRLVGMHDALSRQGGGSGSLSNKGSGEKKLELDRRKIEHRISELKKELEEVAKERQVQRKRRRNSKIPQISLVGYTNAGKSTIMNQMLEKYGAKEKKRVLEKDMLFATLETSVRNVETGDHKPFFLVDTVGFIHKLPHGLVKAFHSTLEEVKYADLLLQVIDFSDPLYKQHMQVTEETLKELGAGHIPMLYVYNKTDCTDAPYPKITGNHIYLAAKTGSGLEELVEMIKEQVYDDYVDCRLLIPYYEGSVLSYFMENTTVMNISYEEDGVHLWVNCHRLDAEKWKQFLIS